MKFDKNELKAIIKKNRPTVSETSLETYSSRLINLPNRMHVQEIANIDVDFYMDKRDDILKFLSNKTPSIRKSILACLYVLTLDPKYNELMRQDIKETTERNKEQKRSAKQIEGWLSPEEIKKVYDEYYNQAKNMLNRKKQINNDTIVKYFVLAFLSGAVMAPRRSLDICKLKIRNYDEKTENYYAHGQCIFNIYKTAKHYGTQIINVVDDVNTLIKKWKKINKHDYLLFGSTDKPLSSTQITFMLNKIFNKKISVDILRSIYLSHYYKDTPAINDIDKLSNDMGNSLSSQLNQYVKKE